MRLFHVCRDVLEVVVRSWYRLNDPVYICEHFLWCRKHLDPTSTSSPNECYLRVGSLAHSLVFLSLTSVCSLFLFHSQINLKKKALGTVEQILWHRCHSRGQGGNRTMGIKQVNNILSVLWENQASVTFHRGHKTYWNIKIRVIFLMPHITLDALFVTCLTIWMDPREDVLK